MSFRFVDGKTLDDYRRDVLLRSAVERQIEIIGEAARLVSQALENAHPEIPWRSITAQRHVLAHAYGDIDDARVWTVATEHVPRLINQLLPLSLLPNESSGNS